MPAVSDDPAYPGERGHLADVGLRLGPWTGHRVYVCGSPVMVRATVDRLATAGIAPQDVHFEDFGTGEGGGPA